MKKFFEYLNEGYLPTSNYGSLSYKRLADIKENFDDNFIDVNYRSGKTKTWNAKSLKEKIKLTAQRINQLGEDVESDNESDITREISEMRDEYRAYKHAKKQFKAVQERFETKKIRESAPPDKSIEKWVKDNKARFKQEYGDDYERFLYGKAWAMFRDKKTSKKSLKEADTSSDDIKVVRNIGGKTKEYNLPREDKAVEAPKTAKPKRTSKMKTGIVKVGQIPTQTIKSRFEAEPVAVKPEVEIPKIKKAISDLRKAQIYADETIPPAEYFKAAKRIDDVTIEALATATKAIKDVKTMPKTNKEMAELAKNLYEAKQQMAYFKNISDEIETYFRTEGVPALFELKDEGVTRVLELSGFLISMDKTTKPEEKTSFDYEKIYGELNKLLPHLNDLFGEIKEKFKEVKMSSPRKQGIDVKKTVDEASDIQQTKLQNDIDKLVDVTISQTLPVFDRQFELLTRKYKIAI